MYWGVKMKCLILTISVDYSLCGVRAEIRMGVVRRGPLNWLFLDITELIQGYIKVFITHNLINLLCIEPFTQFVCIHPSRHSSQNDVRSTSIRRHDVASTLI